MGAKKSAKERIVRKIPVVVRPLKCADQVPPIEDFTTRTMIFYRDNHNPGLQEGQSLLQGNNGTDTGHYCWKVKNKKLVPRKPLIMPWYTTTFFPTTGPSLLGHHIPALGRGHITNRQNKFSRQNSS